MRIYIGHSKDFDYQNELYRPLRASKDLTPYEIILPHESTNHSNNARDFYQNLDLFIAEVSYPATGLGIELAWAHDAGIPIVCISRKDAKISGSLTVVTDQFYTYDSPSKIPSLVFKIAQSY